MKVLRLRPGVVLADEICALGQRLVDGTLSKLLPQLQEDGEELWGVWKQSPEVLARQRKLWPELDLLEMITHLVASRLGCQYGSVVRVNIRQPELRRFSRSRHLSLVGFYAIQQSAIDNLYDKVEVEEEEGD